MRCWQCGYELWNLTGKSCPECGDGVDVRRYAFEAGAVAFGCPGCGHRHAGEGEHGLPSDEATMTCAGCGRTIEVAYMSVIPLRDGAWASRFLTPWEERNLGLVRALWETAAMVVSKPLELVRCFDAGREIRTAPPAVLLCVPHPWSGGGTVAGCRGRHDSFGRG